MRIAAMMHVHIAAIRHVQIDTSMFTWLCVRMGVAYANVSRDEHISTGVFVSLGTMDVCMYICTYVVPSISFETSLY